MNFQPYADLLPVKQKAIPLIAASIFFLAAVAAAANWLTNEKRFGFCATDLKELTVRGTSMSGEFESGDTLVVDQNYYQCRPVRRGDIAIFEQIPGMDRIVKNVYVLPGDNFSLNLENDIYYFYLNGRKLLAPDGRPYQFTDRKYKMLKLYEDNFKGVMPKDTYFVFGSNPFGTRDSSQFGPVTIEQIRGRVLSVKR